MPDPDDLESQIQRVTRALTAADAHGLDPDVVERTVRDCFAERGDARVKDFVSLLAEKSARDRLRRLRMLTPAGSQNAG